MYESIAQRIERTCLRSETGWLPAASKGNIYRAEEFHMKRSLVVVSALLLALAATLVQSVVTPTRVVACSCAPPQAMAAFAEPDVAIFSGTVGRRVGELVPVAVGAWYHGARPAEVVWLSGGWGDDGMCDLLLTPGEQRFMVVHGRGEPFRANTCAPNALLGTAAGNAFVAEAQATFGAPQAPPPPEPLPEQPFDWGPLFDAGMAWVIAGVVTALLILGLALLVGRRRPLS